MSAQQRQSLRSTSKLLASDLTRTQRTRLKWLTAAAFAMERGFSAKALDLRGTYLEFQEGDKQASRTGGFRLFQKQSGRVHGRFTRG